MALLIENHIRTLFVLLFSLFIMGFSWFFWMYQDVVRENAVQRLREHTLVISHSLWRYEDPPVSYLELAARSNNYRTLIVTDESDSVYVRITAPGQNPLDEFLTQAFLLPISQLEEPVIYSGKPIGMIRVYWQNRAAYVYFYVLICLVLLFVGIWFFCSLYIAKRTLKDRVRERTEDLHESRARLQAILDNAEAVVYLKDVKGRYITVNQRFENLFKVERGALAGLRDDDIFPRRFADVFQENDRKIISGQAALQFEESAPDDQGRFRDYISVKFPLKRADGTVYAVCGISTDITDMKLAEEEVRHLRNYLSNIIDSMPSVIIGVDREGTITLWNRRAEQVSGFPAGQALGRPLDAVYPKLLPKMPQVREAIITQKEIQTKKQARSQGGTAGYEDVTVFPLVGEDVEGAVIRIDDVTDQVRMEEMMVQSEKMLSVGGLAAGMAHEINNPLAGMMQTANVMKLRLTNTKMTANLKAAEKIGVSMDHIRLFMEQRGIFQMLDAIADSGARVAEIVDNMLSFARKTDAVVSSHNPCDLMDRILELAATDYDLKKKYDFKAIRIVKDYEENLPMIPCEGGKIQQVILNILRNGAHAMLESGQKDPCFTLKILVEKGAGMLRIEVRDNGPGMEDAVQKRIFDPFFTTKPPGVGTGLGLSVSYFIVTENHGGTMGVSSTPGKGANFIVRLPMGTHYPGQENKDV